eukprot:3699476-Rhodomonas_salina.6
MLTLCALRPAVMVGPASKQRRKGSNPPFWCTFSMQCLLLTSNVPLPGRGGVGVRLAPARYSEKTLDTRHACAVLFTVHSRFAVLGTDIADICRDHATSGSDAVARVLVPAVSSRTGSLSLSSYTSATGCPLPVGQGKLYTRFYRYRKTRICYSPPGTDGSESFYQRPGSDGLRRVCGTLSLGSRSYPPMR